MITHLHLEYLGLGQLPIYDVENNSDLGRRLLSYHLDDDGKRWTIQETCRGRLMISTEIDTWVEVLEPQLRRWLRMIEREGDGTLWFPIRNCGSLPGSDGTLIIAGCAFVPDSECGTALEGADPVSLIMEVAQGTERFMQAHVGCTPLELMVDLDTVHPIVADTLFRAAMDRITVQREQEQREGSEERSRALLHEFLDDVQLAEMNEATRFHVQGADGHTYLIAKGHGHNVFRIENGERTIEYCLVCQGWVPVYDLMLTQMLLLQTDPDKFIETANIRELGPSAPAVIDVLPLHDAFARINGDVDDPLTEGLVEDGADRT
jgi:hypothetical protein